LTLAKICSVVVETTKTTYTKKATPTNFLILKKMKIAIVILNYNGKNHLEQFLPSVLEYSNSNRAENASFSPEVIVADNASTDDSIPFLQQNYPDLRLIRLDRNYGFAEGYNQALAKVKSDVFVLLNSDVEVTENWLAPIVTLMENDEKIAACQPKIRAFHQKTYFEHAGASGGFMDSFGYPFCRGRIFHHVEADYGQYDDLQEIFWATGAALFIKSDLYQKIGGLDGDYFAHMEEIDLCWRLRKAGYKIMVCPESTVYHVGGGTLNSENPFKTYLNFRNNLVTILKNEVGVKTLFIFFIRLVLDGLAALQFLLKGEFRNIWAVLKAHFYIYGHAFSILRKRMKSQQLVDELYIGEPRKKGKLNGSIVLKSFAFGKKKFTDLEID
jgi:GT2 family glycosyltransferase